MIPSIRAAGTRNWHRERRKPDGQGKERFQLGNSEKVWQIIDAYRLLLVGSLVLAGASVALQLYVPILFGRAIDGIAGPGKVDIALVKGYTFQILVLVVLSSLATWAMNLINNKLAFNTVRDIRSRAIRQIQQLPLPSWTATAPGTWSSG